MWLLHLCDAHQEMQSWAEAAQCAVGVAGVIMQVSVLRVNRTILNGTMSFHFNASLRILLGKNNLTTLSTSFNCIMIDLN
jgi:hypothetical protein